MPSLRPIRALCVVALLLSLSPLYARVADEAWIEVRSPHFTVLTDGGEKKGREVAKRFEEMRAVFATFFFKDRTDVAVPIEIIAVRSSKEMRAQSPIFQGKTVDVSGYFQSGQDRDFVVLDLSAENRWTAVFHEYAHVLINSHLPPMPVWFDEGLADFYSTLDVGPQKVKLGEAPEGYGPYLVANGLWPVEKLFAVQHDSKEYNENGDRRSQFYAESWLVVHFLMDRQLIPKMDVYEQAAAHKASIGEAIQRAFGMSSKDFDLALHNYLAENRGGAWMFNTPPNLEAIPYNARAVPAPSAKARLADLHLHMKDRRAEAMAEFQAVIAVDPNEPVAHRGLGYVYLTSGDWQRAGAEFRKAAAQDEKDPLVHYYAGTLALRDGTRSREDIAAARTELERATALNPGMAEAFGALGQACALQEDWPAATAAMRRALQLSPREDRYALELARDLTFEKQFDEAEALLVKLQSSQNAAVQPNAAEALALVRRLKQVPADRIQVSGNRFQVAPGDAPASSSSGEPATKTEPANRAGKMGWLSGTLVSVDCSKAPAALMTIEGYRKTWKMYAEDYGKLPISGSQEKFSCSWRSRKVAVNYREGGSQADAIVVSLELQ